MMVNTSELLEYMLLGPGSLRQVIVRYKEQVTVFILRGLQIELVTDSLFFFFWSSSLSEQSFG